MKFSDAKKVQLGMSSMFFFTLMSLSIQGVVFPIYMRTLGYSDTQIGFALGASAFVSIFSSLIWGILDDKTKKTQRLLQVVFGGLIICAFAMSMIKEFILFLLLRIGMQIFSGGYGLLSEKTAIQMEVRYKIPYNHVRIFGSLGYAIVLLPVLYLVEHFNNYQIIFFAMILFYGLSLLATHLIKPLTDAEKSEADQAPDEDRIGMVDGLKVLVKSKGFIFVAIIYTFFFAMLDVNTSFQGIHITESLGAPATVVSYAVLISAGLSEVPFMFIGPTIQKRIGWFWCIFISIVAFLTTLVLESVTHSWSGFLLIKTMHGLNVALMFGPILMLVRRHVPQNMFATAMSILLAIRGISVAFSSFVIGFVIDKNGSTFAAYPIYIVGLFVALIFALVYYQVIEKKYKIVQEHVVLAED